MSDEAKEQRLLDILSSQLPDVFSGMEPKQIESVQIARGSGFPTPDQIWQSTDGQTVPASWSHVEGYGFRILTNGGVRFFPTTNWPIVRIYPSSRADHLATTIHDPYRHPGQRITRTLVRYPTLGNVAALWLLNDVEVPVELTPAFIDTAESE